MFDIFGAQKRELNQLYIVRHKSIRDLYRINTYAAQLQGILGKLDTLLSVYESMKDCLPKLSEEQKKQYAKLLNDISTELHFLKATSDAMDDQLKDFKKTGDIECSISGNVLGLKKEANKMISKLTKITTQN